MQAKLLQGVKNLCTVFEFELSEVSTACMHTLVNWLSILDNTATYNRQVIFPVGSC